MILISKCARHCLHFREPTWPFRSILTSTELELEQNRQLNWVLSFGFTLGAGFADDFLPPMYYGNMAGGALGARWVSI